MARIRKVAATENVDQPDGRVSALADIKLAQDLKKYTHQIWLAGLGAFSRSELEGGKSFENLVAAGEEIEDRTRSEVRKQLDMANSRVGDVRSVAEHKVDEVKSAAGQKVGEVKSKASDTWDKVEKVFDDRVSRALQRLGVPSKREIEELNKKLDELTAAVEKLQKSSD